ncbi:MAG: transposase [Verrucomicrobiota bacterium]|jgi:REP element-mobilizing transposase RayT
MARKLRVEYPGAVYHVINRGDRREPIFQTGQDREMFLQTLAETCQKTGWQVHAYCLMLNHFHLVVETPVANLVSGMKWFLGTYTARFNRRHRLFGHLFSGRYKSLIVEGSGTGYLRTVCDYVHLNPARAKLLAPEENLSGYVWSSYPAYLRPARQRPGWLRTDRLLGEHGLRGDTPAARREFARRMEARRVAELDQEWKGIRRGWCLGGREFRKGLLEEMRGRTGPNHSGEARRETEEAWAEQLMADELQRRRWTAAELEQRRKGDAQKIKIARRLRQETTMTLSWIGKRLNMGVAGSVANLLRHARRKQ